MDWLELIRASRLLAGGQPSQDFLRRAISTAYYAMFLTRWSRVRIPQSEQSGLAQRQSTYTQRQNPIPQGTTSLQASNETAGPCRVERQSVTRFGRSGIGSNPTARQRT